MTIFELEFVYKRTIQNSKFPGSSFGIWVYFRNQDLHKRSLANGRSTSKTLIKCHRFKLLFRRVQRQENRICLTNKKTNMNLEQMQMTFQLCPRSLNAFCYISCELEVKVRKQWSSFPRGNLSHIIKVFDDSCPNAAAVNGSSMCKSLQVHFSNQDS